ncbi:hypothetical protein [Streptomyces sp. NPDC021020]|uniref:hypothetical protein n=1 Tax=Streptomyces sp. NPDC021020 TaxID=3365109 RepID=UPI003795BB33
MERKLRCPLGAHATGDHHAFVLHLDGCDTGSVWTSWAEGQLPQALEVRDDCCAVSPRARGSEPCCEFAGHPGGHTFDIDDPASLEVP